MAIIVCTDPRAGAERGYDPNRYCTDAGAVAAHAEQAHVTSYAGLVLGTAERNGYDDSDFIALVWDEEAQAVIGVEYASTRGWTYHNSAVVDATPQIREKAVAWQTERLVLSRAENAVEAKRSGLERVERGMEVRSLTTRGRNVGVVGIVKWMGASYNRDRVGLSVPGEDRLRYLDLSQVARTDLPADMGAATALSAGEAARIRRSAEAAARHRFGGE